MENRIRLGRKAVHVEVFSNFWMAMEFIVAIIAGIKSHSVLLIAFGLDSALELVSGCILIWRLNLEFNGAETSKVDIAEKRAERFINWILILLVAYILISSIYNLWTHEVPDSSTSGLLISFGSIIVMPILMFLKRKLGKKLNSHALVEDSICNFTCFALALTVLIGLFFNQFFGFWWAESVASLFVAALIAKEAIGELRE
ncbi:cation transporter [Lactobacillus sp. Sy-1]|uniref:cation transporter n=1 Tax=Lactobacillus sp. Sy-1 TaxID=2109645 RepID=UPI001C5BB76A|nr:cation transporter [Lactobacillus sp. Sy-1]MBW1606322.1 cation transporter [Lactobacillus sp. Sy-1]